MKTTKATCGGTPRATLGLNFRFVGSNFRENDPPTNEPSGIELLLLLSSRRDSKWLKFLEKIEISINLIAQTYVPALAAELVRKVLLRGGRGDFGEDTHSSLGWENIIVWLMVGGVGRWRFHRKEWGSVQFSVRVCMSSYICCSFNFTTFE